MSKYGCNFKKSVCQRPQHSKVYDGESQLQVVLLSDIRGVNSKTSIHENQKNYLVNIKNSNQILYLVYTLLLYCNCSTCNGMFTVMLFFVDIAY